jgi:hypothetical protein
MTTQFQIIILTFILVAQPYADKKENQIFLIYREIRVEQLQSHI